MKLGLLADIHEHTVHLSTALSRFKSEGVDQVVFVGDLVEMGPGVKDVCRMLEAAGVIGVWGNHDFGLCFEPTAKTIEKYGQPALDFMRTLKPRLVIDDCYIAHVEPWLNPEVLEDLWYFEGPVDAAGRVDRVFDAVPQRIMFAGHYHRWLHVTPHGLTNWSGEKPLDLSVGRHFVVIHAVCAGRFAIYDSVVSADACADQNAESWSAQRTLPATGVTRPGFVDANS